MPHWPRWSLALLPLSIAACGGSSASTTAGTGGAAGGSTGAVISTSSGGPGVDACPDVPNAPGNAADLAWPAANNTGHDINEGDSVHFHWSGSHNVLQVASFTGQTAPTPTLGDAMWAHEIRSGDKQADGSFDWNTGTSPCGYRPGLYYFVDQDNPAGGVVAVSLTVTDGSHYAPKACSALSDPSVYGGRYASYAARAGCTVFEVNNFQTEAHYDWVQPIFVAKQGDLVVFRWTGEHNVVQVHDVDQDMPLSGGVNSGPKTNCVGGPHQTCANGPANLGEFVFDTTDYRPGILHFSDQCALACTGHTTGMNMEVDLRFPVPNDTPLPPTPGGCCAIDKSLGKSCRVVDIYNANDGAQLDYNLPVGKGDLVRFRWAGKLQIYQSTQNPDGSPTSTKRTPGVGMTAAVECVPGPHMGCLGDNTKDAEFLFDVGEAIAAGRYETDMYGVKSFAFHAVGENTSGFTSADSGTRLYVDESIPSDHVACP